MRSAQRERRSLVWHQAVLPNLKKLPKHDEFVGLPAGPKPRQTIDQMQAIAMQWNAVLNAKPQT